MVLFSYEKGHTEIWTLPHHVTPCDRSLMSNIVFISHGTPYVCTEFNIMVFKGGEGINFSLVVLTVFYC